MNIYLSYLLMTVVFMMSNNSVWTVESAVGPDACAVRNCMMAVQRVGHVILGARESRACT